MYSHVDSRQEKSPKNDKKASTVYDNKINKSFEIVVRVFHFYVYATKLSLNKLSHVYRFFFFLSKNVYRFCKTDQWRSMVWAEVGPSPPKKN